MNSTAALPARAVPLDAIVFTLLVSAYLPMRFIIQLPPIVPGSVVLTALLVLIVAVYWLVTLLGGAAKGTQLLKWTCVVVAIMVIAVAPTLMNILLRYQTGEATHAHDGLVQTEAATRLVLAGQNPYAADFALTPMSQVEFNVPGLTQNPALVHYAYLPLTFLLPLPVQAIVEANGGWFDQRFVHLIFFGALLLIAATLTSDPTRRFALTLALGLNPLIVGPLIEGRNDVLVLTWLLATLALMQRRRWHWSAVTLGLAAATKHPAWVFVPFYLIVVGGRGSIGARWQRIQRPLVIIVGLGALLIGPWVLMNPAAFYDDVVAYLAGTSAISYPIHGLGLGAVLVELGVIQDNLGTFPFGLVQLAIGLPLFAVLALKVWRSGDLALAVAATGLMLFVAQFFSRLFNDNYFGVIGSLWLVAALLPEIKTSEAISASEV